MLERRTGSSYRIVRIFSRQVLLARTEDPRRKYFYREFSGRTRQAVEFLQKLRSVRHPCLLELADVLESESTVGIYCEYYSSSLQEQLQKTLVDRDEESLLNTLEPVRQAIECLHDHGQHPTAVAPRNIVVTEEGDVKFMDDALLEDAPQKAQQPPSREQDYAGLLETALTLVEGSKPQPLKSLPFRLRKVKQRLGRSTLSNFLSDLYERTRTPARTKRIRKRTSINNENKQRANPRAKLPAGRKCLSPTAVAPSPANLCTIKPLN